MERKQKTQFLKFNICCEINHRHNSRSSRSLQRARCLLGTICKRPCGSRSPNLISRANSFSGHLVVFPQRLDDSVHLHTQSVCLQHAGGRSEVDGRSEPQLSAESNHGRRDRESRSPRSESRSITPVTENEAAHVRLPYTSLLTSGALHANTQEVSHFWSLP